MAHTNQKDFCKKIRNAFPEYFKGKYVLDIGSLDVNGTNKYLFNSCDYVGLDIGEGPNVDVISVGHLYDAPDETFDVIISTEVFEHDMFYEQTIKNIIRMLKPDGFFIFTCASTGRPEHGTRRTDGGSAPLLESISEEWADYYKNLTEDDFRKIDGFEDTFPGGWFEYNPDSCDLYFFGIKGGIPDSKKDRLKDISKVYLDYTVSFDMVPKIEIKKSRSHPTNVEFFGIDSDKKETLVYQTQLHGTMWARPSDIYFNNWKVCVDGKVVFHPDVSFDSVCAVVATYPNSTDVKNKTVETIRNIKNNLQIPTICSTHIDYAENPSEIINETDHYVMNPINTLTSHTHYRYYRGNFDNYNVFFDFWETGNGSYHGPAVHQCYWNGVKLAKQLGYQYAILTNFDMVFSKNDLEKIKSILNTVLINETDGFFLHSISDEGPVYTTVMCIVNVDMFLKKFPFEILDENDYNTLFKVSKSESNGLENMYYHILKRENLTIIENSGDSFFESDKCHTNSQSDYLAVIPLKRSSDPTTRPDQYGIFIKKANKNVVETKLSLSVTEIGRPDPILEQSMIINTHFQKVIPIVLDKRKNYEIKLLDQEGSRIIKQTRRVVYAFQDLEKNGIITEM